MLSTLGCLLFAATEGMSPVSHEFPGGLRLTMDSRDGGQVVLRMEYSGVNTLLPTDGVSASDVKGALSDRFKAACTNNGDCIVRAVLGDAAGILAVEWVVRDGRAEQTTRSESADIASMFQEHHLAVPARPHFPVSRLPVTKKKWRQRVDSTLVAHFDPIEEQIDIRRGRLHFTLSARGMPMDTSKQQRFAGFCYDETVCWFRGLFANHGRTFAAEWSYVRGKVRQTVRSEHPDMVELFRRDLMPPKYGP
jgi:hypothetical protein